MCVFLLFVFQICLCVRSHKVKLGVEVGVEAKMSKIVDEDECPSPTCTEQSLAVKPLSQVRVRVSVRVCVVRLSLCSFTQQGEVRGWDWAQDEQ